MTKRRVVVTGMGAVSTFGNGVDVFWDSISNGVSGIKKITLFDTDLYRSEMGAEVPPEIRNNNSLRSEMGDSFEDATFFAALAADEALKDSGLEHKDICNNRTGCIIGTLCSSSKNYEDLGRMYFKNELDEKILNNVAPTLISYQLNFLLDRYKIKGPASLISTACSSATDAIGFASDMITDGQCDIMMAGGGDVISEVIHAGFNSVMSISKTVPSPFDKNRSGFMIGEGAAILILESIDYAEKRGAHIYAEIMGYGLSNSAYHLSATSDDGHGESLAMKRAIKEAQISEDKISYVNAHGTGTFHNDKSEIHALNRVFTKGRDQVSVNSIKSMIGHCMGAAGALEAVSTVKTINTGIIPPTINFNEAEEENEFDLVVNERRNKVVEYGLSNSFGFAGNNSSLVIGAFQG